MSVDIVGAARGLTRNPLGVIGLFVVLVYGIACLVAAFNSEWTPPERFTLVLFIVIYPVLILSVFAWLVVRHSMKLYAPSDFKNDESYLATLTAAVSVGAAVGASTPEAQRVDVEEIASSVAQLDEAARRPHSGQSRRILWVDDRPENNSYLRKAFVTLGVDVTIALNTNEAMELLDRGSFAAIITDMGRKEGPVEGYVLIDAIRERGIATPILVFAGSGSEQHRREARQHGAQGSTNDGKEVIAWVTRMIARQ